MKKIPMFLLLVSSLSAIGQDEPKEAPNSYQGVIDLPGRSKEDLFKSARHWFVDYFHNSNNVIQSEDKDDGQIIGKGIIFAYLKTIIGMVHLNEHITIQVDCKDGKYRYRIYDIGIYYGENSSFTPEDLAAKINGEPSKVSFHKSQCVKLLASIDQETQSTVQSLKRAMQNEDTF